MVEAKPVKLETERLLLRPFALGDEKDLLEYLEKPEVHCFASMALSSLEEARKAVSERSREELYFAIVLKENGKVIGEIDAVPEYVTPEASFSDTYSPCWMLNRSYQGRGYAFEAAEAFFQFLFEEKGARRIFAYTEDDNLPSQHLCEKLGMRREGVFQEFVSFVQDEEGNPIYEDTMQYAILKKEWLNQKSKESE